MFCMTLYAFPLSLIFSQMGLMVLPAEALRLFPSNESVWLGVMLAIVGISQLVCPIAGKLSDQCRCWLGRRQPFCVVGTLVFVACGVSMWYASVHKLAWLYFFVLFAGMVTLNTIYSASASIAPDFIAEEQKGEASGMLGVCQFTGNLSGMAVFIFRSEAPIADNYPLYVVVLSLTCMLVFCAARERSTSNDPEPPPMTWEVIKRSFCIDIEKERDFFWVFVGRTFYYVSVSCQVFIYYFLRDVMFTPTEALIRFQLAVIVVSAQCVAVLCAYPLGLLSEKIGRKKLIYAACFGMASTYAIYLFAPLAGEKHKMTVIYVTSAYYGLGSGCYLAVDYALALDCLPPPEIRGTSEALGLWGISGFLGSSIGPMLGGVLLEVFGNWGEGGHYSFNGYVWMHSMGIVAAFFAAYFMKFIKSAN